MDKEFNLEKHRELVNAIAIQASCKLARAASWKKTKEDLEKAEQENKPISLLEYIIGMRLEKLEWEVRDAIKKILEKGYTTYYSGYEGNDGLQTIYFLIPGKLNVELGEIMNKIYRETGVYTWWCGQWEEKYGFPDYNNGDTVYISGITFVDTRGDPLLLQGHWNLIAELLPPSGYSLLKNNSKYAQEFRKANPLTR